MCSVFNSATRLDYSPCLSRVIELVTNRRTHINMASAHSIGGGCGNSPVVCVDPESQNVRASAYRDLSATPNKEVEAASINSDYSDVRTKK